MATAHVGPIACGVFLVYLDVAQEAGARVTPFEQIVTEYPIFGKAPFECALECVDVINPFADERSLAEQVLVHIGDGARIGVDSRLAAEQPRIARPVRARQAHGHARLQYPVPLGHHLMVCALCRFIEARCTRRFTEVRTIQRVRHRAHKLPRRITRELCICVQSNHVLYRR